MTFHLTPGNKRINLLCSLFSFFIVLQFPCVAQDRFGKGYYVTSQRDTVRGFIKYKENFLKTVPFRKDLKSPVQELQPTEAIAFGFEGGNHYQLMNFPENDKDDIVFARKVVEGNVNMYMYYAKYMLGSESKKYFVISKTRSGGTPEERMAFKQKSVGAMNVLFADCPQVMDKTNTVVVQEEPLVEILEEYHRCRSESYRVYVAEKRRRVAFGVFAFYNVSQLEFAGTDESLNRTSYDKSADPGLGAMMLITPSRKHSSIFSLQVELLYHQMKFAGNSYYERSAGGYDFKYTGTSSFNLQRLTPRVGFRLTGRSNVINPYLSMGVSLPSVLPGKSDFVKDVQINDATETYRSEPVKGVSIGAWVSAGLKKPFRHGGALFAEAVFEMVSVDMGGTIKMANPRIGYIF